MSVVMVMMVVEHFVVDSLEIGARRDRGRALRHVEARRDRHLVRRLELGVSQEELGHLCDVNRTFVAKIELAQNQPTLTVLLPKPSRPSTRTRTIKSMLTSCLLCRRHSSR